MGRFLVFSVVTLLSQTCCWSWSWSFSSNVKTYSNNKLFGMSNIVSEFSIESLNDQKGIEVIGRARTRMLAPNSCWQTAYQNVFEGCSKTLADEESRSRLAWHLSDCFQLHTGRPNFPHFDAKSTMKSCLMKLQRDEHQIYLEYFLEANSICHHLQTDAFKRQTEKLVNELKRSAEYVEDKLETIEEQGERLLHNSKQVHDSLSILNLQAKQVAKTTKNVEDHVSLVLKYSENIYEQSIGIADSQKELNKGQDIMKEKLAEGMGLLEDSYNSLGVEITNLRKEAVQIEKEIEKVGNAMFSKMNNLQSSADDIGNMAGNSLDKQKKLLDGQAEALNGLRFLSQFQSKALEESRLTLQKLAEFGHKQQEELLERQKQLHQSHDHLVENSKLILETQEAFEVKQATTLVAIERLFNLHSAMLFESRVLITMFVYSIAIFLVYMLTSVRHAYNVRHSLYLANRPEIQGKIIHVVRLMFGIVASIQYLYVIFTYRLTVLKQTKSYYHGTWRVESDDSELNWSSWVDTELTEDVSLLEDPSYLLPNEKMIDNECVESSSVTTLSSKIYNLRKCHLS